MNSLRGDKKFLALAFTAAVLGAWLIKPYPWPQDEPKSIQPVYAWEKLPDFPCVPYRMYEANQKLIVSCAENPHQGFVLRTL